VEKEGCGYNVERTGRERAQPPRASRQLGREQRYRPLYSTVPTVLLATEKGILLDCAFWKPDEQRRGIRNRRWGT